MNHINILHLSDIHFKKKATDTFREDVRQKMIETIQSHQREHSLEPDFVTVTGDIAFSGKKNEYKEAELFFNELKVILPKETEYLIIPGNHDVDRDAISSIFSLHTVVQKKEKIDRLLEKKGEINTFINPKFKAFRAFAKKMNPNLNHKDGEYFWVKDFKNKDVSFLGLNTSWACENEEDKGNITLGYPQVREALKRSKISNRIVLMHHPPKDWLNEIDFSCYCDEIFKNCGLILCGHIHSDRALVIKSPAHSCISLGANASYTEDKDGFIGFQFIQVIFEEGNASVEVWPYRMDKRGMIRFKPDYERYEGQEGVSFKLDTFNPIPPSVVENKEESSATENLENFELKICEHASINDINLDGIKSFIEEMDERRTLDSFGEVFSKDIEPEVFLEKTQLRREGTLTNAALLLYGKFPQRLPGLNESSIICTRLPGVEISERIFDDKICAKTLANQIQESMEFVKRNIRKGSFLGDNAKRVEVYEYPIEAVREAIANAVIHRDYRVDARCQVRIYDNRIEVWSPGNLVDSISIEDLYRDHNSYSRNSVIAKHLYASLHIEKRGFGTIRMVKYMKELGLEEPIFENVGNDFVVTLYGPESTDFIEKSFETDLGPIHPTRKVLILSANPTTTPKLLLDEEVRKIKEGLRRSKNRDRFEIKSKFGMRLKDFRRTLLDHEPQIVHFIGHGTKEGLLVEDEIGMAVLFPAKALSGLFKLCSKHVECVILSACYSATQAEAISKHIKYIIGMRKEIKDKASIEFAVGFYDALGAGKSVETAFEFGRNAVLQMFPDIAEYNIPILIKRV